MAATRIDTQLPENSTSAKIRTSIVRRTQRNGWRHVYEVQSIYDKTTRNTRILKSKLLGKLPPGETELEKMVPTNKRYSPMRGTEKCPTISPSVSSSEFPIRENARAEKGSKKRGTAFLSSLIARVSLGPKHQETTGPDEETLTLAGRAAMRAPSHEKKFPVRLVEVTSRSKLAALYRSRLPIDATEEETRKAEEKAMKGAALLALIVRRPEKDAQAREILERGATAGAALMNVLTVLHIRGYAAKTVSACEFENPEGLYDKDNEMILAFILCGTPKRSLPKSPDDNLFKGRAKRGVLTTW